jgi:hypothetical protein
MKTTKELNSPEPPLRKKSQKQQATKQKGRNIGERMKRLFAIAVAVGELREWKWELREIGREARRMDMQLSVCGHSNSQL